MKHRSFGDGSNIKSIGSSPEMADGNEEENATHLSPRGHKRGWQLYSSSLQVSRACNDRQRANSAVGCIFATSLKILLRPDDNPARQYGWKYDFSPTNETLCHESNRHRVRLKLTLSVHHGKLYAQTNGSRFIANFNEHDEKAHQTKRVLTAKIKRISLLYTYWNDIRFVNYYILRDFGTFINIIISFLTYQR